MQTNINTTHKHYITKKINNWSEYNKSLIKRGNLSIFISEDIIKNNRIVVPKKTGKPGRPQKYTDELIEFILTVGQLLHLPLRQLTGFMEFLHGLLGLASDQVPDYTTLDRRAAHVTIRYSNPTKQNDDQGIVMLIDSSGFKVFGEGEWMVRKHGATYRRTWRETHIAINHTTRDIVDLINTTAHVHDNTQLKPLLTQVREHKYNKKPLLVMGPMIVRVIIFSVESNNLR